MTPLIVLLPIFFATYATAQLETTTIPVVAETSTVPTTTPIATSTASTDQHSAAIVKKSKNSKVKTTEGTTVPPPGYKVRDTPDFLKLASDSARKEYIELESNVNIPLDTKQKAQDAWAVKNGDPVLSAYRDEKFAAQKAKEEEDERMAIAVSQLSKEAQKAHQEIIAIRNDLSQTKTEMNAAVQKKLNKLPKRILKELTFASQ